MKYLILMQGIFVLDKKFDGVLNVVSSSLWSNLKSIKVGHSKGSEWEVYAVVMLLKNAPSLESLVMYCDKHFHKDVKKRNSVREELLTLRASSRCEVVLSHRKFRVGNHKFL